jgi:hypothetical protein
MRPSLLVVVAIAITGGAIATAGPLTPPAGPPAPTGKTLTEVEPRIPVNAETAPPDLGPDPSQFTIVESGSYYLTGNVAGVDGKTTISITASNVTLDLNGFTVSGPTEVGQSAGLAAIYIDNPNVVVRNGLVADSQGHGIVGGAVGITIEDVAVCDVDGVGITLSGEPAMVRRCIVSEADEGGIKIIFGGSVIECGVFETAQFGISVVDGRIEQCWVKSVILGPAYAIAGSTLLESLASEVGQQGVIAVGGSTVRNCSFIGFGFAGIELGRAAGGGNAPNFAIANLVEGGGSEDGAIVVRSAGNRVEGNMIANESAGLGFGIRTNGAGGGNIVINNSVRGAATAYDLDPADAAGPIIGPLDLATTTSPVANIAH